MPSRKSKSEILNEFSDVDIDAEEKVTIVRRENDGMWMSPGKPEVCGETKADALEAVAKELRERE